MNVWELSTPASWGQACTLVDAALEDSSTKLFAAVNGWDYPISMPELLLVIGLYGDKSERLLPFHDAQTHVTEEEHTAAVSELLEEIRIS